ncbi:MAG: capsule assembly Wzi family protein [Candidatus Marinimicrobia bacterium]|jgi:hypothetical protein|nr:capsule assembly Wzi family protein [Candidatus Neomarinimicrobiota bacterium]|tara:strand:+ start:121 stop:1698 length:1578 start_codon:yes stop_codon:yes gene_type:complete
MIKILRLEVLFIGLGICLLMDGILGQNLVRSKAPSLYLVECQVIATGKVDGYLSNRWDHSWQAEKGFGGSDLKTTDWGDIRLRKNRLKFYPALEGTGSAKGSDVNRSGTVLDVAPVVTVVARYHLPPTGKYNILLWSRFEKHSVLSEENLNQFGHDFSSSQEPGRVSFHGSDSTWSEYDVGDGGIILFYPGGEFTIGKSNPIWGPGYTGQLFFSKKAPSFSNLGFRHKFSENWQFSAIHGWLNSNLDDSTYLDVYGPHGGLPLIRKYLAAHRIDVWIKKNLRLGFGESVIYGGRGVEPAYLIPFLFTWSSQHDLGDSDNLQMFFDFDWVIRDLGRFYGAFYLDEWDFVDTFSDSSRSWTAYQIGATISIPALKDWSPLLRVEYTRLSPYVYVHRSQVNTFEHHGHWLGYWSGPNSDNFFTGIDFMPRENLWLQLFYQKTRRGEVTDETIDEQYDHQSVDFLYKTYDGDVETRTIMGIKGAVAMNSWLKLELELHSDNWIQRLDVSEDDRTSDQKMDAVLKLVIGL